MTEGNSITAKQLSEDQQWGITESVNAILAEQSGEGPSNWASNRGGGGGLQHPKMKQVTTKTTISIIE